MEKNTTQRLIVELTKSFSEVWKSLYGQTVELKTSENTPFIARARLARRRGSSVSEEVLVFLINAGTGKLIESSRCYSEDWGFYFNHLGKNGQRIGMFCKAVDFLGT